MLHPCVYAASISLILTTLRVLGTRALALMKSRKASCLVIACQRILRTFLKNSYASLGIAYKEESDFPRTRLRPGCSGF